MWNLALACAFFVCIHLMISGTDLKAQIISSIGRIAYYALFSVFSIAGLIWITGAFVFALNDSTNNVVLWGAPLFLRVIAIVINLAAFLLVVVGALSPSPTHLLSLVKMPQRPVRGIIRVSRHPVLAGITLWALAHMLCNGNLANWLFFGSIVAVCVLGAINIDRKRQAALGEAYDDIKKRTSIIPFVAIIDGRTAFAIEEIGFARMLLAVSLYSVILVFHEILFNARIF